MKEDDKLPELSLLGGPLHRLGCRLGLVRGGTNTIWLGLAIGMSAWGVLMVLALLQGLGHKVFSLAVIGGHVRLLVVIPLFFVCEAWVVPRMDEFVRTIVRSGVVPENALLALQSEVERVGRWKDSWLPEALWLLIAVLMSFLGARLLRYGATAAFDPTRAIAEGTLFAWFYWIVCMTFFRFLVFRWFWLLGLWSYLLWCVSRLKLHLVPTHPDGAAGLGYLEVVHVHFTPLIVAISALQSASFAEELSAGTMTFEAVYPALALMLMLVAVLFLGPLFIFAPKLWACRVKGLTDYMEFATHYVNGFDRKWLGKDEPPEEHLLGTPDLQSLADLSNSVSIVRNMRWVPLSPRLVADLAMAALLPILPLFLLKYPVDQLAARLFQMLTGL